MATNSLVPLGSLPEPARTVRTSMPPHRSVSRRRLRSPWAASLPPASGAAVNSKGRGPPVAKPLLSALQAFLLALACLSAYGQGEPATGRVVGMIKDRTGAAVAASTVELRGHDSGLALTVVTDAEGRYSFDTLPAGRYRVVASAPGYMLREDIERARRERGLARRLHARRRAPAGLRRGHGAGRPAAVGHRDRPAHPAVAIPVHDGADYLKTIPGFSVIRKGGTDGDPVLRGMAGSRLGVLLDGENILGGCGNRMTRRPPTPSPRPTTASRCSRDPRRCSMGPGTGRGGAVRTRARSLLRAGPPRLRLADPGQLRAQRPDRRRQGGRPQGLRAGSATRSAMDDYQDGGGQAVHSRYERWSANGALGWTPDESTRVELSGARSDGEAAYADRMMDGVQFSRAQEPGPAPRAPEPLAGRPGPRGPALLQLRRPRDGQLHPAPVHPLDDDARIRPSRTPTGGPSGAASPPSSISRPPPRRRWGPTCRTTGNRSGARLTSRAIRTRRMPAQPTPHSRMSVRSQR